MIHLILTIIAFVELGCYYFADIIQKYVVDRIAAIRENGSMLRLKKEVFELGKQIAEYERKERAKAAPAPTPAKLSDEEKAVLLAEIDSLKAKLQEAESREMAHRFQLQEKDVLIQKHKSETEHIRYQFKQSEKDLEYELQDIVKTLIEEEKQRRAEAKAARDEAEFDKLEDIEDFEADCEMVSIPKA